MLLKYLNIAKEIAEEAGHLLLEQKMSYAENIQNDPSPKIHLDEMVGEVIRVSLQERASFPVYSEEKDSPGRLAVTGPFWWVDPIDGTRDFVRGGIGYGVSIGLLEEGKPVVGAIYQPRKGKMFSAALGEGAYLESRDGIERLHVSKRERLIGVMGTRAQKSLRHTYREFGAIILQEPLAGFTCKVCMIAEGKADLYIKANRRCNEWDSCAMQIILEEAGGVITDLFGRPLEYNQESPVHRGGIVASNNTNHEKLIEFLLNFFPCMLE